MYSEGLIPHFHFFVQECNLSVIVLQIAIHLQFLFHRSTEKGPENIKTLTNLTFLATFLYNGESI